MLLPHLNRFSVSISSHRSVFCFSFVFFWFCTFLDRFPTFNKLCAVHPSPADGGFGVWIGFGGQVSLSVGIESKIETNCLAAGSEVESGLVVSSSACGKWNAVSVCFSLLIILNTLQRN